MSRSSARSIESTRRTRWDSVLRSVSHPANLTMLVLAVAATVRFWRLDFHSFWFDEAVSLQWAGAELGFIWEKTFPLVEEKHPPAYYALLHGWLKLLQVFGLEYSDAAIRSLGALLGVVTTWATLHLSRRASGLWTGTVTGLLVALSPLLVWYSQELRMFQPATTGIICAALALYCAWHSSHAGVRLAWWLGMAGALSFALYSYLFSAFIMPAAGLSLLYLQRTHPQRRRFVEGVTALAVVTVVFVPLAQNAWGVNAAESTPGQAFADFWGNLANLLDNFTLWRTAWPAALETALAWGFGALLLAGLLPLPQRTLHAAARPVRPARADLALIWLWLGIPLLIANLLLSRSGSIFDEDRYLLFLAPFALWAIARGLDALRRLHPAAGTLLAVAAVLTLAAALPQVWSPANYRENWRATAQYVIDYQRANPHLEAAAVAHIDYTNLPLQWYLRQELSHDELPVFFPYGGWIDPNADPEEAIAPYIRGIEDLGVDTLWLTQAHLQHVDPEGRVESWIASTYPLVTELYPAGIKLTGYAMRSAYAALPPATAQGPITPLENGEAAPGLELHGCAPVFDTVAARDRIYHPPSGWVHIRSWWSVTDEFQAESEPAIHARVVGPNAIWGEKLDRATDTFGLHPPQSWTPGAFMRAEADINLNPLTPPGTYAIQLTVETESGADANRTGVTLPCGEVTVR